VNNVIELVLGGARSGKSAYAEKIAINSHRALHYVATAAGLDAEMQQRINHHQAARSAHWITVEEPLLLAGVLQRYDHCGHVLLVDCLTLWLSNHLLSDDPESWLREKNALLVLLPRLEAQVILVSNEVGQGIVPLGEINRRFVDEAGRLHQDIAALADKVTWITAGLAQQLKNEPKL
jgi:adenosylcobinamide kinase / adenosylcobinamide-phosphate guanylyltransferase